MSELAKRLREVFLSSKQASETAHDMVYALCQPRNSEGARDWVMSVPARPDHDPDLVITAGLNAGDRMRRMLPAIADLVEAAEKAVKRALAVGSVDRDEDVMEGLFQALSDVDLALDAQAVKEVG